VHAVSTQAWSAQDYAANARFVADLAREAVALLAPRAGERILDLPSHRWMSPTAARLI
jgi:hypothetical protein